METAPESPPTEAEVTALLEAFRHGDAAAGERLLPLVYGVLHEIAARQLRRERPDHTLQPTILLHEAWLRLTTGRTSPWNDRAHFLALATRAMRRLLVNHARARRAGKRRGDMAVDFVDDIRADTAPDAVDLIALNDAMEKLSLVDERAHRVVELRFFGALDWDEIATVVGASEATVKRDWRFARVWLRRQMDGAVTGSDDPPPPTSAPEK